MEAKKILNLLSSSENEYPKFARTKIVRYWQWIKRCLHENPIKVLTSSLEPSLRDFSDAYALVTGNIAAVEVNNTRVAFKNCAPFRKRRTQINGTFIDKAEHINIAMPISNLIEYNDNYSDTSGSLW